MILRDSCSINGEKDQSNNIIISATNISKMLDIALFRRRRKYRKHRPHLLRFQCRDCHQHHGYDFRCGRWFKHWQTRSWYYDDFPKSKSWKFYCTVVWDTYRWGANGNRGCFRTCSTCIAHTTERQCFYLARRFEPRRLLFEIGRSTFRAAICSALHCSINEKRDWWRGGIWGVGVDIELACFWVYSQSSSAAKIAIKILFWLHVKVILKSSKCSQNSKYSLFLAAIHCCFFSSSTAKTNKIV